MGKLLRVDLTARSYKEEEIDEETRRKFLGGRGLGTKISVSYTHLTLPTILLV